MFYRFAFHEAINGLTRTDLASDYTRLTTIYKTLREAMPQAPILGVQTREEFSRAKQIENYDMIRFPSLVPAFTYAHALQDLSQACWSHMNDILITPSLDMLDVAVQAQFRVLLITTPEMFLPNLKRALEATPS